MQANVGGPDRILRIIAGLALIAAAALGWIGAWGWIGLLVLPSGVFRFCFAYRLLGLNTCGSCCSGKTCKKAE